MAVCECGHSEERHNPEEDICNVGDCDCDGFVEVFTEDGEEDFADAHDDDFYYTTEVFSDDQLIPEDEDSNDEETD